MLVVPNCGLCQSQGTCSSLRCPQRCVHVLVQILSPLEAAQTFLASFPKYPDVVTLIAARPSPVGAIGTEGNVKNGRTLQHSSTHVEPRPPTDLQQDLKERCRSFAPAPATPMCAQPPPLLHLRHHAHGNPPETPRPVRTTRPARFERSWTPRGVATQGVASATGASGDVEGGEGKPEPTQVNVKATSPFALWSGESFYQQPEGRSPSMEENTSQLCGVLEEGVALHIRAAGSTPVIGNLPHRGQAASPFTEQPRSHSTPVEHEPDNLQLRYQQWQGSLHVTPVSCKVGDSPFRIGRVELSSDLVGRNASSREVSSFGMTGAKASVEDGPAHLPEGAVPPLRAAKSLFNPPVSADMQVARGAAATCLLRPSSSASSEYAYDGVVPCQSLRTMLMQHASAQRESFAREQALRGLQGETAAAQGENADAQPVRMPASESSGKKLEDRCLDLNHGSGCTAVSLLPPSAQSRGWSSDTGPAGGGKGSLIEPNFAQGSGFVFTATKNGETECQKRRDVSALSARSRGRPAVHSVLRSGPKPHDPNFEPQPGLATSVSVSTVNAGLGQSTRSCANLGATLSGLNRDMRALQLDSGPAGGPCAPSGLLGDCTAGGDPPRGRVSVGDRRGFSTVQRPRLYLHGEGMQTLAGAEPKQAMQVARVRDHDWIGKDSADRAEVTPESIQAAVAEYLTSRLPAISAQSEKRDVHRGAPKDVNVCYDPTGVGRDTHNLASGRAGTRALQPVGEIPTAISQCQAKGAVPQAYDLGPSWARWLPSGPLTGVEEPKGHGGDLSGFELPQEDQERSQHVNGLPGSVLMHRWGPPGDPLGPLLGDRYEDRGVSGSMPSTKSMGPASLLGVPGPRPPSKPALCGRLPSGELRRFSLPSRPLSFDAIRHLIPQPAFHPDPSVPRGADVAGSVQVTSLGLAYSPTSMAGLAAQLAAPGSPSHVAPVGLMHDTCAPGPTAQGGHTRPGHSAHAPAHDQACMERSHSRALVGLHDVQKLGPYGLAAEAMAAGLRTHAIVGLQNCAGRREP